MKNLIFFISTVLLLGLIINGCKRKEDETINEPTTPITEEPTLHQVNAYVQLPQGSSLNISGLNLNSNVDLVQASVDGIGIDVLGNHYGVYATNAADDVVMIGYGYPGQDSLIVNAQSTALALVMLSHAAMSLSDAGKTELVHRVLDDPEFNSLVGTVEASIASGADIFHEDNTVLMNKVVALFESVQTRSTNSEDLPVTVHRSDRNFVFVNGGKAYSTVIGVYNSSDELVGPRITVKGIKIVPTSLWELFQGGGGTVGSPIEHPFQLVGDGDFTIKYRTGLPGFGDGSEEHDIAFRTNIIEFGRSLYYTVTAGSEIPQIFNDCENSILSQLESIYSNSQAVNPDSQAGAGAILMAVTDLTLSSMGSLIEISQNCSNHSYSSIWFPKLLKHWNFLGTAFGVISNGANTTIFGYHWANAVAVVDECYHAQGNSVTDECSCETQFTSITDPRDGQVYNTVQIGNQVWFAENLRYSGSIPQVSSEAGWAAIWNNGNPTGQPAWCYYLNDPSTDTIYGKLYNWYAAVSGGLCPSGWHIPTDAEWTILINHLGGEDVAGGKMKSTIGWQPSWASNESCFSMPDGGWRGHLGDFTGSNSMTSLWSSTQYIQAPDIPSIGAWSRSLYTNNLSITSYPSLKNGGFYCRCLQN